MDISTCLAIVIPLIIVAFYHFCLRDEINPQNSRTQNSGSSSSDSESSSCNSTSDSCGGGDGGD